MKLCWLRLQTKRDPVEEHLQGTPRALEGRARTWDWLHLLWARGPCCSAPQALYPPIRELCPRAPSLLLTPLPLQGNWELLNTQTSRLPSHMEQGYKWDTWNRRHSRALHEYCTHSLQPKLSCNSGSETGLRETTEETNSFLHESQKDTFQNTSIPFVLEKCLSTWASGYQLWTHQVPFFIAFPLQNKININSSPQTLFPKSRQSIFLSQTFHPRNGIEKVPLYILSLQVK